MLFVICRKSLRLADFSAFVRAINDCQKQLKITCPRHRILHCFFFRIPTNAAQKRSLSCRRTKSDLSRRCALFRGLCGSKLAKHNKRKRLGDTRRSQGSRWCHLRERETTKVTLWCTKRKGKNVPTLRYVWHLAEFDRFWLQCLFSSPNQQIVDFWWELFKTKRKLSPAFCEPKIEVENGVKMNERYFSAKMFWSVQFLVKNVTQFDSLEANTLESKYHLKRF